MTKADLAHVGGVLASDVREIRTDLAALDEPGFWVAVLTFEGAATCARFGVVRPMAIRGLTSAQPWQGPAPAAWASSLDRHAYTDGVRRIRERIATGDVYQVNLCRTLSAPVRERELVGLAHRLGDAHPSRYPALVALPSAGLQVCSASPELFLARAGDEIETKPIKGTGATPSDLKEKDRAENIMIVDMARNDLGRVAATGSVRVGGLCELEDYPGLVQLVSTVRATLRPGTTWAQLLAATFPPASVSGAPKSSALRMIKELEPVPRGPYCGAIGFVDNREPDPGPRRAVLAVGIRTFWLDGEELRLGVGAGVTWGSDPEGEWDETELKARRLLALASRA